MRELLRHVGYEELSGTSPRAVRERRPCGWEHAWLAGSESSGDLALPVKKPALCEGNFEGHGGDVGEPKRGIGLFEQRRRRQHERPTGWQLRVQHLPRHGQGCCGQPMWPPVLLAVPASVAGDTAQPPGVPSLQGRHQPRQGDSPLWQGRLQTGPQGEIASSTTGTEIRTRKSPWVFHLLWLWRHRLSHVVWNRCLSLWPVCFHLQLR